MILNLNLPTVFLTGKVIEFCPKYEVGKLDEGHLDNLEHEAEGEQVHGAPAGVDRHNAHLVRVLFRMFMVLLKEMYLRLKKKIKIKS